MTKENKIYVVVKEIGHRKEIYYQGKEESRAFDIGKIEGKRVKQGENLRVIVYGMRGKSKVDEYRYNKEANGWEKSERFRCKNK